ncbi:MAG: hypothetical protein MI723_14105 [Caulobacterales bacterium]|nr:hypothetical protein [Caulobacterales bacterium]
MKLVAADTIAWREVSQHRAESPLFRRLIQGEPGALDNFEFSQVKVESAYYTPRHKHNFDQVRIMLEGEFDYGGGVQREGMIGYFPAGTPYTQQATTASVTLLLQVGAACRQGYLGYDDVEEVAARLAARGAFEDGIYVWTDEQGVARRRDGYEAVYQEARGEAPDYPRPRFLGPVIMNPAAVAALPDAERGGATRRLGVFNEYGLALSVREAAPGETLTLAPAPGQRALAYCVSGAGRTGEGAAAGAGLAIDLLRGEALSVTADASLSFLQIDLPDFAAPEPRAEAERPAPAEAV